MLNTEANGQLIAVAAPQEFLLALFGFDVDYFVGSYTVSKRSASFEWTQDRKAAMRFNDRVQADWLAAHGESLKIIVVPVDEIK